MRRLNIGAGPRWTKPGWTTLDHYRGEADITCDLRASPRLPIASHTLTKVYCSHLIEHLKDDAALNLLSETHRVLEYGGIARFSCPDLEKAIAQFQGGICDPRGEVISKPMKHAESHLRLLNVVASFRAPAYRGIVNTKGGEYSGGPIADLAEVKKRLGRHRLQEFADWVHGMIPADATYVAHINAFWPAKLQAFFRRAGFEDVRTSRFRESGSRELRGVEFDNRPQISLFVEARAHSGAKYLFRGTHAARRTLEDGVRRARSLVR